MAHWAGIDETAYSPLEESEDEIEELENENITEAKKMKKHIGVQMPLKMAQKVEERARKMGLTTSSVIKMLLHKWLINGKDYEKNNDLQKEC